MPPTVRRSLKSSFLWVALGNILYAGAQFLMMTSIANILGATLLGRLALCLAIVTPALRTSSLQLRGILATDRKGDHLFGHYLGLRLLLLLLVPLVVVVVGLFMRFDQEMIWIATAVVLMKLTEGFSELYYGLFQQRDWMSRIGIARTLRSAGLLIAIVVGIIYFKNLYIALYGSFLLWIVVFSGYEVPYAVKVGATRPYFAPFTELWRLFRQAVPMAGVMVMNAISVQIPTYLIVAFWGERMLGEYTAVAQFMIALTLLTGPLGQVAAPRLAEYLHSNHGLFWVLFWKLQALCLVIGAVGFVGSYLVGGWVLSVVLKPDYADYNMLLAYLALAIAVQQSDAFTGIAATALRAFKIQLAVRIFTTMMVLVIGWILISRYGIWAMPATLVVAPLVSTVTYTIVIKHRLRRDGLSPA